MELDVTRRALHRFVNPFRSDCFRGQFAPHSCMALRAQFPEPVDVPADNLCIGLPECIQQECVFPVYGFFVPAVSLIVSYQLRRRDEARSRSFELREIRRMPELEPVEYSCSTIVRHMATSSVPGMQRAVISGELHSRYAER